MSPDFLVPAFELALDGRLVAPQVRDALLSVAVTSEPDSLDHFRLSVANQFPELPFTHGAKADLFREGSAATIKLGYLDALETVFDGEITRVSPVFGEEETPTITIEGHSRLHRLRGATRTRSFLDVKDSDIATQIATEAGLQARVDTTATTHPYVLQANQTDFDFLLERAERIRYELLADGKRLVFRKPADGRPKTYTLVWGDAQSAFAPARATLPLLRFQPTLDALAPVSGVAVRGQDPATREPISGTGAAGDEVDQSGTTAAAVVQRAFGKSDATVVDLPVATREEADEIAKALFNRRSLRLVTGTGACVGMPAIRAGSVVQLDGVGRRFSGPYLITRATHRLDDRGYETSFTVRRGAVG